jgi:hypothetical protein
MDSRRDRILEAWRDHVLATYAPQSERHLRGKRGPIGEIIARCTSAVVDGFLARAPRENLEADLDELIRLRAVQEFSPTRSVGFVFALKDALREALSGDVGTDDLAALDRRVDELALVAFDLFVRCREKVFDLRAKMMRDRAYMLMRRAGMLWEETEDMAEPEVSGRGDER